MDWGLAELLAYGSLLQQGYGVRLTGQDVQRGTFSHRHVVYRDNMNELIKYTPLNEVDGNKDKIQVYNSILSEYCVMGFEFGHSLTLPKTLAIWEAQFGDFSNGAQIIIDQFISSAESKWQRYSGLTLLLPHGYEGQGPEHSSARPERFLQLCAEQNMYVTNPTTPANLFHMLRRQMLNEFRVPLIVFTPKSLLRHPKVVSPIKEFEKGSFQELIDDDSINAGNAKRVVLCTGKLYYELLDHQQQNKIEDIAIVRLEQLYPLPKKQLEELRKKYAKAKEWVWAQEEPINMGYWSFILRQLRDWNLDVIARKESASPAVGGEYQHIETQTALIKNTFGKLK